MPKALELPSFARKIDELRRELKEANLLVLGSERRAQAAELLASDLAAERHQFVAAASSMTERVFANVLLEVSSKAECDHHQPIHSSA